MFGKIVVLMLNINFNPIITPMYLVRFWLPSLPSVKRETMHIVTPYDGERLELSIYNDNASGGDAWMRIKPESNLNFKHESYSFDVVLAYSAE